MGGAAALSWDSAPRLGFLWENVRNGASAGNDGLARGGGGEGRRGIRAGAAVQTPG